MQDRFKVGDKLVFRVHFSDVCEMLGTSFYDVLTSVYKIIGTEGRCYLMKSDDSRGRVWKIRKSRIDRLGTRVTVINDVAVVTDDERRGSHLVSKSEKEYMKALVEAGYIEEVAHEQTTADGAETETVTNYKLTSKTILPERPEEKFKVIAI